MSYITVWPNLIICPNQSPAFIDSVKIAIAKGASQPVGKRLLEKIAKAQHVAWIIAGEESITTFYDAYGAVTRGGGSDAEVKLSLVTKPMIGEDGQPVESPFFIDFFHELIHVYRGFYGKNNTLGNLACKKLWQDDEEYQVMKGIPSKNDKSRTQPKITENAIRKEHGMKPVYSHLKAELLSEKVERQIQLHSTAQRSMEFFQFLLESNQLQPNSVVSVDPSSLNPNRTPPVLGKIYPVSLEKILLGAD